jgi:hypothetical protein
MSSSASSSSRTPSEKEVKEGVWKLMDQAGRHPKLTPRMVRTQLEKKLSQPSGSLKTFRPLIKKIIFYWWVDSEKELGGKDDNSTIFALQSLINLAKAAGKFPAVLNKLSDKPEEKVIQLRQKLKDHGLEFSDIPTPNEISKAKKNRERETDLDGIDTKLIIAKPRRGEDSDDRKPSSSSGYSAPKVGVGSSAIVGEKSKERQSNSDSIVGGKASSSAPVSGGGSDAAVKKRRIIEDDEEAEY